MKAIRIHEYGDANRLKLEETPRLAIRDDQILVRVRDAGVNPIDWKIRAGYLKDRIPAVFPLTIGQDFAGEVVERGKQVEGFSVGQRVFGFAQGACGIRGSPGFHGGSHACVYILRDRGRPSHSRLDSAAGSP